MKGRRDKERTYLALTVGTLVIGGGVIIALVYGPTSLLTSLPFLLFGAFLITLLWLLVSAVSNWRERSEREYHESAARHIAGREETREEDETDGTGR